MNDVSNHSVARLEAYVSATDHEGQDGDFIPSSILSNLEAHTESIVDNPAARNRAITATVLSEKDITVNPALRLRSMTFSPLHQRPPL